MIHVEILRPDTTSERLSFDKPEVLIGRKPGNDIVLGGLDVSGNHACLQVAEGQIVVVDLGSTNGTFVRGERVQMSPIADQEEIRVAGYVLRINAGRDGDDPATARPGEPTAPPLIAGLLEPPPLLAGDLGGADLPPLVADAPPLQDLGDAPLPGLGDAPPLLHTPAPRDRAGVDIGRTLPPAVVQAIAPPATGPAEARRAPPAGPTTSAPPPSKGPDLAAIWADSAVTRLIARDGDPVELQRRGGAPERLPSPPVDALAPAIAAIAGLKDLSDGPCSRSLADGAALFWARGADGRLVAALERPAAPGMTLADAIQAGALDDATALRLLDAVGRGRALLFAARPGADALALALALAAAGRRPGALIRGHVAPVGLPEGAAITVVDAIDPPARAAAVGLAQRLGVAWIVVDDAVPPAALRAALRAGVAVLLILDIAPARVVIGSGDLDLDLRIVVAAGPRGPVIDRVGVAGEGDLEIP